MSRARLSIIGYGLYLASAGLVLALVPNVLLSLAGVPEDHGVWVRLVGTLAFVLGAKGVYTSSAESVSSFRFDNYTRTFAGTFIVILVLVGIAPKIILALAAADYAGALWTELALRMDKRSVT